MKERKKNLPKKKKCRLKVKIIILKKQKYFLKQTETNNSKEKLQNFTTK